MNRTKITPPLSFSFRQVYDALKKQPNKTVGGLITTGKRVLFDAKADITRDGREFFKLPYSNRIYENDWGYTTNSMGKNGQRIGQYARPLDDWCKVNIKSLPKKGDIFKGKINDLFNYDRNKWRRRDILFYKHDLNSRGKYGYPTQFDSVVLIDTNGNRYELNFSKPEDEDKVCLGTPGKLKPWYQNKGFDDKVVPPNERVYFEYTGDGIVFFILTEQEYSSKYNQSLPIISVKSNSLKILNDVAEKLRDFNYDLNDNPRESYHRVLTARGERKSFVDKHGNVADENLQLIDWALRSYFIMNRGNRMGGSREFTKKLSQKFQSKKIKTILAKFCEVDITVANIEDYKSDTRILYESLSNSKDGLSRDRTYFCVGATKVMHCLFPEFFIVLDRNVGEALRYYYGRHNSFDSYWRAIQICRDELIEWQKIYGDTDSLLQLDDAPTTLTRIFDKCASIMAIRARKQK